VAEAVNQQPGGGSDYPFVGPSGVPGVLDVYLSYEDGACAYAWPFALAHDGTNVDVLDAGGANVFSAPLSAAVATPWGDRRVLEWVVGEYVLRLVVRDADLAAGTAALDPRTYHRLPQRLRSVRVAGQVLRGNVRIEAGYNVKLAASQPTRKDGGRFAQRVNLDAVPGAGMGRQPGCGQVETFVRRINNIGPDPSGNFVIDLDDCFRGQLPAYVTEADGFRTAQRTPATLGLYNDCKPCYDCAYFVNTYRGLKRVWYRWQAVAAQAERVRDTFAANRQRWLDQRTCRINHAARLVAIGGHGCKTFVGGMYCNASPTCLQPVELRFTFQLYRQGQPVAWPDSGVQLLESYVDGSPVETEESYPPVVAGPVFRYTLDYSDPQQTSQARMRLCVACAADNTLGVTMTAHAPTPPPNPKSGATADLPTVDVPANVLAVWGQYGVPAAPTVRAVEQKTVPLNPDPVPFECEC
jgi:hypothetical protein